MTEPIAYRVKEAAEAASVSEWAIRKAIQATDPNATPPPLAAKKYGTEYRITRAALLDWVERLPDA